MTGCIVEASGDVRSIDSTPDRPDLTLLFWGRLPSSNAAVLARGYRDLARDQSNRISAKYLFVLDEGDTPEPSPVVS